MFLHVVDDACKNSPPAPSDYPSIAPLWNIIENQSGKSPECYYAILYNSELLLILFFFEKSIKLNMVKFQKRNR
jgi:hypothetical protein